MNDMMVRISAKNNTAKQFDEVVAAARSAGLAVERVNTGLGRSANYAAMQQKNLLFQLNDIGVSLAGGANPLMVLAQQGSQIATIYGPEEGGVGKALKETGNLAAGLVTKFWPIAAAVGIGTAAVAGMTAEINKTSKTTVTFGDTANAMVKLVSDGIANTLAPAVAAMAPYWDAAYERIKIATAGTYNVLVRGWMAFMAEMELVAGSIGHIFEVTWGDIQNGFVDFMQVLTDSVMTDVNALRRALGQEPIVVSLDFMKSADTSGWSQDLLARFNSRMATINSTDYAAQAFDAWSKQSQSLAEARAQVDATADSFGKLGKSAADAAAESAKSSAKVQGSMWDMASEASSLLGQIFEDNKAAAIAGAVLDASAGIAKTLAAYPYPWNIGMAGLHAAAAAVQVQKIASTSQSSTSVDTSIAGGSSTASSASGTGGVTQGVTIQLTGNSFSAQGVMGLLNELQSALGMQGKQITISHVNGA